MTRRNGREHAAGLKQGKWSRIFNVSVIVLSVAVVAWIVLRTDDLRYVGEALTNLEWRWLAAAFACYGGYLLADGAGLRSLVRARGYRLRLGTAFHLSLIGVFYGYITPGYSGGQPMQIYHMVRRRIDAGASLSAVTVRHFFNHLTIVGMTLVLWALHGSYVRAELGHLTILIIIGCIMTFANVPLTLAVALNRPLVERFVRWCIRFLARRRLCRHPEAWEEKSMRTIAECHSAMTEVARSPVQVLRQLLISSVQGLCLMAVPYMVYRALGLSGTAWNLVLTVSFLLFVSASYAPLPGATGAQEGGFIVFFDGVFGASAAVGLLIWRFVTFYLCLLVGCADTVFISSREPRPCIRQTAGEEGKNI